MGRPAWFAILVSTTVLFVRDDILERYDYENLNVLLELRARCRRRTPFYLDL